MSGNWEKRKTLEENGQECGEKTREAMVDFTNHTKLLSPLKCVSRTVSSNSRTPLPVVYYGFKELLGCWEMYYAANVTTEQSNVDIKKFSVARKYLKFC